MSFPVIKNLLIKRGVSLLLVLFNSLACIHAQDLAIQSNLINTFNACGEGSFEVSVENITSNEIQDINLTYILPLGVTYDIGSVAGDVSGVNNTDLSQPMFSLPNLPAGQTHTFTLMVLSDCGVTSNPNDAYNQVLVNYQGGSQAFDSDPYNINIPSLSIIGTINKTFTGQTNQVFFRSFTIVNGGFGSLDSFCLIDVHDDGINILSSSVGILSPTEDTITLHGVDFTTIGNGDDKFDFAEQITITQEVKINCNNSNSQMSVTWGCYEMKCNDFSIGANVINDQSSNTPLMGWDYKDFQFAGFCENGFIELYVVNQPTSTNQNGEPGVNIILEAGFVDFAEQTDLHRNDCLTLESFSIGTATNLTSDITNYSGYGIDLGQITSDPDGPGGLQDIDGDGMFDDLAIGDTLVLRMEVDFKTSCVAPGACFGEINEIFRLNSEYENQCDIELFTEEAHDEYRHNLQPPTTNSLTNSVYEAGDIINFELELERNWEGFKLSCANDSSVITIIMPPTLSLTNPPPTRFGSLIPFEVSNDTLFIFGEHHEGDYLINFEVKCIATGTDEACVPADEIQTNSSSFKIRYFHEYFCEKDCPESLYFFCDESNSFIVDCDPGNPPASEGVITSSFKVERMTHGWTDATLSTKIDPNTPGLRLDMAMPFDIVRFEVEADVFGAGVYDSTFLDLFYRSFNNSSIHLLHVSDTLRFFDSETNQWYTCTEGDRTDSNITGNIRVNFDILSFLDNCLSGLHITNGDKLVYQIYFSVRSPAIPDVVPDFLPELEAAYSFMENGEAIACQIIPELFWFVDSGVFNAGNKGVNQGCGEVIFINNLAQGAGQSDPNDLFPFEYRPLAVFDSLFFTIPKSLTYIPGSSQIIYEDRPGNIPSGPINTESAPIPEPIITSDANFNYITYYNDGSWPIVDHVSGLTRNTLEFRCIPDCRLEDDFDYTVDVYYTDDFYADALSSPESTFYNRSQKYTAPRILLTPIDQSFEGQNDTAFWSFEICNIITSISNPFEVPFNWVSFEIPNSEIDLIELVDQNNNSFAIESYSADSTLYWARLGTLAPGECRQFSVNATFSNCSKDSILINTGYNCNDYPVNPQVGYGSDGYSCEDIIQEEYLFLNPKLSQLQLNLISGPPSPTRLCEPLTYELKIVNTLPGTALDLNLELKLPPGDGFTIIPGSTEIRYPVSSSYVAVNDPISIPGNLRYWFLTDLNNNLNNDGLVGSNEIPNNEVHIRFQVVTSCDYQDRSVLRFRASALNTCGSSSSSIPFFTNALEIDGEPQITNDYGLAINTPSIIGCAEGTTMRFAVQNLGGGSGDLTTNNEFIRILTNTNLSYVPGSFNAIQNIMAPNEPTIYNVDSLQYFQWPMPLGLPKDSTIIFEVDLAATSSDLLSCEELAVHLQTTFRQGVNCMTTTGGSCEIDFIVRDEIEIVPVEKANLVFQQLSANTIPLGTDQAIITFDYTLENITTLEGFGPFNLDFYFDSNNNGTLEDGIDLLIGAQNINGISIPALDQLTNQYQFSIPDTLICGQFLVNLNEENNDCVCEGTLTSVQIVPFYSAGQDTTLCAGTSATLAFDALDKFSYTWTPATYLDNNTSANPVYEYTGGYPPNALIRDTLILFTSLNASCQNYDTIVVTNTLLTLSGDLTSDYNGSDISCHGANDAEIILQPNGGDGTLTYQWNGIDTQNNVFQDLGPGLFEVTVTDEFRCFDTTQILIVEPDSLKESFIVSDYNGFGVSCFNGNNGRIEALVEGGTGDLTYSWNTDNNPILDTLIAGAYTVTISDENGCSVQEDFNLSSPPPLSMILNPNDPTCIGGMNGSVGINLSGGLPPYNCPGQGSGSTCLIENLGKGLQPIVIMDANGCEVKDSIVLTEIISQYELATTDIFCPSGNEGSITVNVLQGSTPQNYVWSNGMSGNPQIDLIEGNYQVTITDNNQCDYVLETTLTGPAPFIGELIPEDLSCFDADDGRIVSVFSGGTPPYSFDWGFSTDSIVDQLSSGTYSLTVNDAQNCDWVETVFVNQPDPIDIDLTPTGVTCSGGTNGSIVSAISGGTGPYIYEWSTTDTTANISGLSKNTYLVTVTDNNTCTGVGSSSIIDGVPLAVNFNTTDASCFGYEDASFSFDGFPTELYSYSLDSFIFQTDTFFNGISAGERILYVRSIDGCVESIPFEIGQPEEIVVQVAQQDSSLNLGESTNIEAFVNVPFRIESYNWFPEDYLDCPDCPESNVVQPLETTTYEILVTDTTGCFATNNLTVKVDKERNVYIPSAFSPNRDGINDFFTVFSDSGTEHIKTFRIFNRWGALIFENQGIMETNIEQSGWDGKFKGQPVNAGVYVYMVEILFIDGVTKLYKGDVSILR